MDFVRGALAFLSFLAAIISLGGIVVFIETPFGDPRLGIVLTACFVFFAVNIVAHMTAD